MPLQRPTSGSMLPWSLSDSWSAVALARLDTPSFRELVLPLAVMTNVGMTAPSDMSSGERATLRRLEEAGWRRLDGDSNEVPIANATVARPGYPEVFLLESARTGVVAFRGMDDNRATSFVQDRCASEYVFGWHPTWSSRTTIDLAASCNREFTPVQLDYYEAARRRTANAIDSAKGIDQWLLTGFSFGAVLALLVGATRSPPLPAVVFAPGGWGAALANRTSNASSLRWSTSIVDAYDPIPMEARMAGESRGQLCMLSSSDANCAACFDAVNDLEKAAPTGETDKLDDDKLDELDDMKDEKAALCQSCTETRHALSHYHALVSSASAVDCK